MPNHCVNRLTVFGPKISVHLFVQNAGKPSPDPMYAQTSSEKGLTEEQRIEYLTKKYKDLNFHNIVPLPGYERGMNYSDKGYELEHATWGVKWGAYDQELVSLIDFYRSCKATYNFTTAWGIADKFFQQASLKYPSCTFAISFYEESPCQGRVIFSKGRERTPIIRTGDQYPANDEFAEDFHTSLVDTHDSWIESLMWAAQAKKA